MILEYKKEKGHRERKKESQTERQTEREGCMGEEREPSIVMK